jgi:hypothetical protein
MLRILNRYLLISRRRFRPGALNQEHYLPAGYELQRAPDRLSALNCSPRSATTSKNTWNAIASMGRG